MEKVYQTKTDLKNGNCFAACLSTLTGIPIDKFDGCATSNRFFLKHNKVLNQYGFHYIDIDVRKMNEGGVNTTYPGLVILSGPTPGAENGEYHAVIGMVMPEEKGIFNGVVKMWHDPHPKGTGIDEIHYFGFITNVFLNGNKSE